MGVATPCADWNVRQLVDHLVVGQQLLARVLRGEPFEQAVAAVRRSTTGLGDDPSASYRRERARVLAAFTAPGVLERLVRVPFGTVPGAVARHLRIIECLVHGWDLATALGLPFDPPAALVEREIAFTGPMLGRCRPSATSSPPHARLSRARRRSSAWPPSSGVTRCMTDAEQRFADLAEPVRG